MTVAAAIAAGCATANEPRLASDGSVDSAVDAPPDAPPDACIAVDETCNNRDDDCDGKTDETYPMKGMTCSVGVGACKATGHYVCAPDGMSVVCDAMAGNPSPEKCDGIDNDCDGSIDEGLANVVELCNGVDDDCDGHVDEGYNVGVACDGPDADLCKEGVFVCDGMGGAICSDTSGDTVEKCNNLDDDCDGSIDEDWSTKGQACTVGLGACARSGTYVCNAAQTNVTCSATAGQPTAEVCGNGVDEDCNGSDAVCPANDLPAGAIDISAGGTWTVDVSAAHDDNWAPSTSSLDCGDQGGRDVFYTFTLPAEEVVYYDSFGSNFDSVIRIFAGACTALGTNLACDDDACGQTRSQGAVDLPAGQYCLVLDQFSAATTGGAAVLHFLRGGRPGVALPNLIGSYSGTTSGKTNLSIASCQANSMRPDVGHFFLSCPGTTFTVDADTCQTSWDTILYLRSGNATTADVVCNDHGGCGPSGFAAQFSGATVAGANLQWLIVDGYGTSGEGAYTLNYTIQ
jgi:hypothetical protein